MAAYLLVDTQVLDPSAYEEYRRQVGPMIERFRGRFLTRGGASTVLEGSWQPRRLVIVEFPDMVTLQALYTSPDYQPLRALRQRAADTNLIAVEGMAPS